MSELNELMPNSGNSLPPHPGLDFSHRVKLHFRSTATPVVPEFQAIRNAQFVGSLPVKEPGVLARFGKGRRLEREDAILFTHVRCDLTRL